MREIKFRAWDKQIKKMLLVDNLHLVNSKNHLVFLDGGCSASK